MSMQSESEEYEISEAEFAEANLRGEEMRQNVSWAISAKYEPLIQRILARLSSGIQIALPVEQYPFLVNATDAQRARFELCGDGYELYFPELDEGIWLPNYLRRHAGSSRWLLDHPEAA